MALANNTAENTEPVGLVMDQTCDDLMERSDRASQTLFALAIARYFYINSTAGAHPVGWNGNGSAVGVEKYVTISRNAKKPFCDRYHRGESTFGETWKALINHPDLLSKKIIVNDAEKKIITIDWDKLVSLDEKGKLVVKIERKTDDDDKTPPTMKLVSDRKITALANIAEVAKDGKVQVNKKKVNISAPQKLAMLHQALEVVYHLDPTMLRDDTVTAVKARIDSRNS